MASVEPGASAATWRSVAAIASLREVHADAGGGHDRRLAGIEAGGRQPLPPGSARLEVDRHEPQPLRDAEAELDQALSLPGLRTRLVDLEHPQAGGDLRPALGEGVEAGSEDDVLADAAAGLFHDQVLDEASTGHDGGAEEARALRVHVRTAAPAFVRGRQPQADLVFEHMRRRDRPGRAWPATRRPAPPCCPAPRRAPRSRTRASRKSDR